MENGTVSILCWLTTLAIEALAIEAVQVLIEVDNGVQVERRIRHLYQCYSELHACTSIGFNGNHGNRLTTLLSCSEESSSTPAAYAAWESRVTETTPSDY